MSENNNINKEPESEKLGKSEFKADETKNEGNITEITSTTDEDSGDSGGSNPPVNKERGS